MKKRILRRKDPRQDGIFSYLEDEHGNFLFFTLEHAYQNADKTYVPKIAPGIYQCTKGLHTLEHHSIPFQAFEIEGIPDFQGKPVTKCLFHMGNYNHESDGCVLLGKALGNIIGGGIMLTYSLQAFKAFMEEMKYDDVFELEVK